MDRLAIPAALVVMAAFIFFNLHDAEDSLEPIPLVAPVDAALPPLPPLQPPIVLQVEPDAATEVDESGLTRERVARMGLLGRETRWLAPLMDSPHWRRDDDAETPTWVNDVGARLAWRVRGDRVVGASVGFQEGALSADLTLLSGFFVGNHDHLPIHLEAFDAPDPGRKTGQFVSRDGRRFYYRAQLATEGEPPYGPQSFEISVRPFGPESPGQQLTTER
jgi:hypothetical protein